MSVEFSYSPIDSKDGEIRLIYIQPCETVNDTTTSKSSADASILEIELRTANLRDEPEPEYIALSYVWGDVSDKVPIKLNGYEWAIGRNLSAALHALRARHVPVVIWADALCINQADHLEKGHQILHMRNVYQTAQKVVAWLGPYHEDVASIDRLVKSVGTDVKYLKSIGLAFSTQNRRTTTRPHNAQESNTNEEEGSDTEEAQSTAADSDDIALSEASEEQFFLDVEGEDWRDGFLREMQSISFQSDRRSSEAKNLPSYTAIERILRSAWWRRAWIVQEFVVARRVEFRVGSSAWDLGLLTYVGFDYPHVISQTVRSGVKEGIFRDIPEFFKPTLPSTMTPFATLLWLRVAYRKREFTNILGLVNALLQIYSLEDVSAPVVDCTDQKDKIYALLGILGGSIDLGIEIRYSPSISVDDVFTDAAGRILNEGGMSLLLLASDSGKSHTLPTWVPDWRIPHRRTPNFPRHMDSALVLHQSHASGAIGTISGDLPSWNSNTPNLLILNGVAFGTIVSVGEVIDEGSIPASGLVVMHHKVHAKTEKETETKTKTKTETRIETETKTETKQRDNATEADTLFENILSSESPLESWKSCIWPWFAKHLREGVNQSEARVSLYNTWLGGLMTNLIGSAESFSTTCKLSRETFTLMSTLHKLFSQTTEWYLNQSEGSLRHVEEDEVFSPLQLPLSAVVTGGIESYWVHEGERVGYCRMTLAGRFRNDLMFYLVQHFASQDPKDIITDDQETCGFSDFMASEFNLFVYAVKACIGWKPIHLAGGKIGMGPADAREDDIVCTFSGTSDLYVLRPVGEDRFQLIGDCYIYNCMDSKDVDGSQELRTFHII